ncbi:MAG: formimidoylglutamase [Bacteroidota bacterium]|nr:formimidoylglutamase [Bacteroidota bacterium]
MSLESLIPVCEEVLSSLVLHPKQALGKNIEIHTDQQGFPELKDCSVAIVGLSEIRNAFFPTDKYKLDDFRKSFYRLFPGNWNFKICDLGDLPNGASPEDTYFALKEICIHLRQLNIVSVFIGGSHDLIFPMYQSYQAIDQLVNIISVDNQFDFSQEEELISGRSYMSRIIMEQPNFLYNYTNLGYQSYYIAQEELDLMEKLHFDSLRLGVILDNVVQTEPFFRDANIAGFDMKSLSWQAVNHSAGQPNGIDARTICALARYAGISDRLDTFGVFELINTAISHKLLAQIVWYFIEGFSSRFDEYPVLTSSGFVRYTVALSDMEMVFYQSEKSNRWWIEITNQSYLDNKNKTSALLPCTHKDYLDACSDKIPDKWWKATKRI